LETERLEEADVSRLPVKWRQPVKELDVMNFVPVPV